MKLYDFETNYSICSKEFIIYCKNKTKRIIISLILMFVIIALFLRKIITTKEILYIFGIILAVCAIGYMILNLYSWYKSINNIKIEYRNIENKLEKRSLYKNNDEFIIKDELENDIIKFKFLDITDIVRFDNYFGLCVENKIIFMPYKSDLYNEFSMDKNKISERSYYNNKYKKLDRLNGFTMKFMPITLLLITLILYLFTIIFVLYKINNFSFGNLILFKYTNLYTIILWFSLCSFIFNLNVRIRYKRIYGFAISIPLMVFAIVFNVYTNNKNYIYTNKYILETEITFNIDIPANFESVTHITEDANSIAIKFLDIESNNTFNNYVIASDLWDEKTNIEEEFSKNDIILNRNTYIDADYYMIYNKKTNEYHHISDDNYGVFHYTQYVLFSYYYNEQKLYILNVD